ncbi:MAG: 16S rRNA (cytosine(967)-C(5))-methyltransferase RsmB [Pseudomonadota bacterium]|uniref:16S rRNA (cytosine(967)-C(5))-methyltransferase RsmB n=1 Tax=Gallaecimonas pentaromativorans TaxID=584787 RepID=UPI00067EE84A|nr:16S rRNA (cytosine(967)-C(5))-methyltransferase RsmB [Gallaecimonas pentaromativorans]MED5523154.1 16S rRNA (cytosine(967)-C(5))-methyltransferase RsmB [Pseudomonadota bacterium]
MSAKLRAQGARVLSAVLDEGKSLNEALPAAQASLANPKDKALLQALCFGALRQYRLLEAAIDQLMDKPLKGKTRILQRLLVLGLYQLYFSRIPAHAAVGETVAAAPLLGQGKLKGLVNGVLRNAERQGEALLEKAAKNKAVATLHPDWLIARLKAAYPSNWQDVVEANNQQAPLWLRVNSRQGDKTQYLDALSQAGIEAVSEESLTCGFYLAEAQDVTALPGFAGGAVSVQDGAAQFAAQLLAPVDGERILDACAAPGGKTAHILELADAEVTALDVSERRLVRVQENLARLKLSAKVVAADASQRDWWDGKAFDRILLDAPCSATGVIRRHPDIRWLRRDQDIAELAALQARILDNCWQMLKPGGTLLYATCSVLPQENREQVKAFLARTADAELLPIRDDESAQQPGWQLLPGQNKMDGFFYARVLKKP